jgi:hypothetical protein
VVRPEFVVSREQFDEAGPLAYTDRDIGPVTETFDDEDDHEFLINGYLREDGTYGAVLTYLPRTDDGDMVTIYSDTFKSPDHADAAYERGLSIARARWQLIRSLRSQPMQFPSASCCSWRRPQGARATRSRRHTVRRRARAGPPRKPSDDPHEHVVRLGIGHVGVVRERR